VVDQRAADMVLKTVLEAASVDAGRKMEHIGN
jgi:hypothetical protein